MLRIALALVFALPLCAHAQQPAPPTPPPVPPAPAPAPVQPAIKLPTTITVPANKIGKLTVEGVAKTIKWVTLTPGLSVEATPDGRTLYVAGPAGSYDLIAYTAIGDIPSDPVRVTVVIGEPPPPPAPPAPPTPPAPADPLKLKLAAAYATAAGTPAQKAEWAKDLAALYRAAVRTTGDKTLATAAALKAKIRSSAATLLEGDDALKEVRQAVAGELAAILPPVDTATVTDDQRTAAADLFKRLAVVLDGLAQP